MLPTHLLTNTIYIYVVKIWISTHTPLAGRDIFKMYIDKSFNISTHTPLAGRDCHGRFFLPLLMDNFNSHAPRGA